MKTKREYMVAGVEAVCITSVITWLFYDSYYGFAFFPLCLLGVIKINKKYLRKKKQEKYRREFQEVVLQIAGCLNAGYSLDVAFYHIKETSFKLETRIEMQRLRRGLENQQGLHELIEAWGQRWEIQEIDEFACMIRLAKQYGGNMPYLIRQLCKNMTECALVEEEIRTMIAAKRLEGNIMIVVPFCILLYMRVVNGPYLQPLYESIPGRILMTICLVVWVIAFVMIEKIIEIEV